MGILDEAIREHLDLKRAHGAGDSELKQLEDEAFGQAERPGDEGTAPDPAAEAPTQFMTQPDLPEEGSRREPPTIADLQEAPPAAAPAEESVAAADEASPEEPADEGAPAEEQPAMEHEIVAEVPEAAARPDDVEPAGPTTEERHAIAEQPTEIHDMEAELGAPGPPNPTDEELVEEEIAEPRLAPADPLAGLDEDDDVEVSIQGPAVPADDEEDEDDAFWNEQRLSDELDQALEAPVESEPDLSDEPDLEADEELEPAEEPEPASPRADEDVLEETPDFLEEAPEDDQLWFEQKPPKDFDFDD
jgi:hypothetical protein